MSSHSVSDDEAIEDPSSFESDTEENKGSGVTTAFSLGAVLPRPHPNEYTLLSLYENMVDGGIDLDPLYQRDVVWNDRKQRELIDSLFRHFYIPPIIFHLTKHEGKYTYICVDGKQRLTSIYRFFDGQIYCECELRTGQKLWYRSDQVSGTGSARRLLSDKRRKAFEKIQFTCVEYEDVTGAQEREIFHRVQLGVALTASEKLAAIDSPRARYVQSILNDYFTEAGVLIHAPFNWDSSRGADFRAITLVTYVSESLSEDSAAPQRIPSVQVLSRWLSSTDSVSSSTESKLAGAYSALEIMAGKRKYRHVFVEPESMAPIEVIMFVLLISVYSEEPSKKVVELMKELRAEVRRRHDKVHSTIPVMRTMLAFIFDNTPHSV
ncbi:hypothetical protein EV122DRAFT_226890 [Schizophyllum commune]